MEINSQIIDERLTTEGASLQWYRKKGVNILPFPWHNISLEASFFQKIYVIKKGLLGYQIFHRGR